MIPAHKLGPAEELYTHIDEDGTNRHFAIKRLNDWLPASGLPIDEVPLEPMYAKYIVDNFGIEMPRVLQMDIAFRDRPLVLAVWRIIDGLPKVVTIDGNHRYVRRVLDGLTTASAYVVPRKAWEKFLVDWPHDITHDQLRNAPSSAEILRRAGITEIER